MAKDITFDIIAKDKASKVFSSVGDASDHLGSKLGSAGKIGALALGGAAVAGVVALSAAMVGGVQDASAYQQLADKTAAVLKSTGNAAHQSVAGIQARASALESMSGVDETLIINGQNVLATFTNVKDGVGAGNDVFNQATTAALNMSTALGQDMQSSTVQLGKALNDPIKGITALSRVGVSFTAEQKDQIKTLVKSGDTMGAQKVILGELSKEFGGAAQAAGKGFAGSMARVQDAIGDTFRDIGMQLLPTLTKLADWFVRDGLPAIKTFATMLISNLGPVFDNLSKNVIPVVVAAFKTAWAFIQQNVVPILKLLWQFIQEHVIPAVASLAKSIGEGLHNAFVTINQAIQDHKPLLQAIGNILGAIATFIMDRVVPVVGTVLKLAFENVGTAVGVLMTVIEFLWNNVLQPVITGILNGFANMARAIGSFLEGLSNIPGFGWAHDAAVKLQGAADSAESLARGIQKIPDTKNVTITFNAQGFSTIPGVISAAAAHAARNAKGTRNFAGGMSWVGEEGPELMYIPAGANIYSNPESMAMASGGAGAGSRAGGGPTVQIEHYHEGGNSPAQVAAELMFRARSA